LHPDLFAQEIGTGSKDCRGNSNRDRETRSMPVHSPLSARADPAASPERKNLILVTHPGRQDWRNFEAIGQEIARLAPDIVGYIVAPSDVHRRSEKHPGS